MKGTALPKRVQVSPNVEPRAAGTGVRYLVLHYTGMSSAALAVDWLCRSESRVSCHYLVDDDGGIVQMVDEELRAWHAGVSSWQEDTDLNSLSVGIEIQNTGHSMGYPDFGGGQMEAVAALSQDIVTRHGILPRNVLAHSDIITLHCPLNDRTRHMIGAAEFARMGRKPLLINTARGGLVDESAVGPALEAGQISGAGFDVVSVEPPPPDHPFMSLIRRPDFILTPHVAWASDEAMQGLADQLIDNIDAFVRGEPRNLVTA